MRLESIYRQLKEGIDLIAKAKTKEEYTKGVKKLLELQAKIEIKLKKKEKENTGKKLQHLMGWYKKLWNGKPPEYLKFTNPDAIIGKHLKELIQIYERNGEGIENLKKDYEEFLRTWKKGSKGILHFRSVLPTLKKGKPSWTDPSNTRGVDYYLNALKEKKKKQEKEILDELFDDDDELPF